MSCIPSAAIAQVVRRTTLWRAGLWSGAFYRAPRPIFLSDMHGIRAAVPARPLVQKALGLWDWEVRRACAAHALTSNMHRLL